MSIFPTGRFSSGQRPAIADHDPGLETDGVLVRPINGQIYLIEEADLEVFADEETRSSLSGLSSRH